jgi:hypothetical protein
MTRSPLIILPLLSGPLPCHAFESSMPGSRAAPQWEGALRLWPGLPDVPGQGRFCPENYPFSPREAAACLSDLLQMGEAALSGLSVGAAATGNARVARRNSEMALLEELGRSDGDAEAARAAEAARREFIERQQAQKVLIWAWQQEERLKDMAGIAEQFSQSAGGLAAVLGAEPDDDMGGSTEALTGDLVRIGSPIALDTGLVPPWRLVAAHALYFLPPEAAIAVEGSMREDILDIFDFTPAPQWAWALGETGAADAASAGIEVLEARAPGWKLLGRTRPTGQAPLDAERVWVAWRAGA